MYVGIAWVSLDSIGLQSWASTQQLAVVGRRKRQIRTESEAHKRVSDLCDRKTVRGLAKFCFSFAKLFDQALVFAFVFSNTFLNKADDTNQRLGHEAMI